MKKSVLIAALCFLAFSAQARSYKLGGGESKIGVNGMRVHQKVCSSHDQCKTGLCKDGKCIYCDDKNRCPAGKTCLLGLCQDAGSCNRTSDCEGGFKCVDGICEACLSGEEDCNCGDSTANGNGGCGCAAGTFMYGSECVSFCDFATCGDGYAKVERADGCCCKASDNVQENTPECVQASDCAAGQQCVDGKCQNCPSGTFLRNGACVSYCDFATCAAGYTKTAKDKSCCCKK